MQKTDKTPLWVYLAFSMIERRKEALLLIWSCVLFSLYCVPWSQLVEMQPWLANMFLIEDWSWVAMMLPITLWYWLSLRWVDANAGWKS